MSADESRMSGAFRFILSAGAALCLALLLFVVANRLKHRELGRFHREVLMYRQEYSEQEVNAAGLLAQE